MNFLLPAFRHLFKNKVISLLNLLGLSTGIAACAAAVPAQSLKYK